MPKQDDKKTPTKKTPAKKATPSEAKPAADKQTHRVAKPSNPFLVENPPSKRGFRR